MNYLTIEQVLFIHYRLIKETGGSHGVRDITLLESGVLRPQAVFHNAELYPDIFIKTAALFHGIIKNHPFIDGNKRTAITASAIFLRQNGYAVIATNKELEVFTDKAAHTNVTLTHASRWFKKKSKKIALNIGNLAT